ncbi:kinase-like domain-containing protein [Aspergillus californicus]
MARSYSDILEENDGVGTGSYSFVYNVSPNIVVKTIRVQRTEKEKQKLQYPFHREIKFYQSLNKQQTRCLDIFQCFILPDHLFLSFCNLNNLCYRYIERQTRETLPDGFRGRLALEYIEKLGFSHNDVHPRNCLLDKDMNLKLSDFDCTTTIGQFLESSYAPWARLLPAGPLQGTYGLCGSRTEQSAVGTLLYYMVYGHEPYEDLDLKTQDPQELNRRYKDTEFPELDRHEVFDQLVLACWFNVYPTMALLAYDCKRKTP